MKQAQVNFFRMRIVDLFAGGGGASLGMEDATGQPVDIAINHDPAAILMHRTNHPYTTHFQEDIWTVDPVKVTDGQPVGLLWASPDCKHFSKAKGEPLVDKHIRGLSWVILRWALENPPQVILMENVEEIQTWGPLIPLLDKETGRPMKRIRDEKGKKKLVVSEPGEIIPEDQRAMVPDPARKGETFQGFIGMLSHGIPADHPALPEACEFLKIAPFSPEAKQLVDGLGYELDYRELVAADYGAPTTRKRFALVARRDGRPVVWPERTHAPADSEEVRSGKCKTWRSAAEIIDWNEPMYSIFASRQEIKEQYGVNAQRPLADNTMRRIIRGVDKFTIRSGDPFIVPTGYGEREGQAPRVHDINAPLPTVVGTGKMNLVDPILAPVTFPNTAHSVGSPASKPVHTITSAGNQVLAAAELVQCNHAGGDRFQQPDKPLPTISSHHAFGVAAAQIIQYHTEQDGEKARTANLDNPLPTLDGANRNALVAAHLTEYYGNGQPIPLDEPMHTATAHDREALTTAILQPFHAGGYHGKGNSPELPVNTITGSGSQSLITSHVVKFKRNDLGQSPTAPLQTITAGGGEFAAAGCQIVQYEDGADLGHWPKVRALLNQYCGYALKENEILLIWIRGAWRYIRDILMRMLTPRELFSAQGFPADYIIDRDYTGHEYPKCEQVARVGNSVSPPMAEALVRANLPEMCGKRFNTLRELQEAMAV